MRREDLNLAVGQLRLAVRALPPVAALPRIQTAVAWLSDRAATTNPACQQEYVRSLQQLAELMTTERRSEVMDDVAEELEAKVEHCRRLGIDMGGSVLLDVNTRRGKQTVGDWQVLYLLKVYEHLKGAAPTVFPSLSSPTQFPSSRDATGSGHGSRRPGSPRARAPPRPRTGPLQSTCRFHEPGVVARTGGTDGHRGRRSVAVDAGTLLGRRPAGASRRCGGRRHCLRVCSPSSEDGVHDSGLASRSDRPPPALFCCSRISTHSPAAWPIMTVDRLSSVASTPRMPRPTRGDSGLAPSDRLLDAGGVPERIWSAGRYGRAGFG